MESGSIVEKITAQPALHLQAIFCARLNVSYIPKVMFKFFSRSVKQNVNTVRSERCITFPKRCAKFLASRIFAKGVREFYDTPLD